MDYVHLSDDEREAVEKVYSEGVVLQAEGRNPYPGSNYVGGVVATLAWVLGEADEFPLPMPEGE